MAPPLDPTAYRERERDREDRDDWEDRGYDYDERRGPRTGLLVLLGLLVVALIAAGAYVVPRMFESAPQKSQVPSVIGMTEAEARTAIGAAGLTVGPSGFDSSEDVEAGSVISQDPGRDSFVDPDSVVTLVISSGKPQVQVPYVVGSSRADARTALKNAKLKVTFTTRESDEPADQVLETTPQAGQSVTENSTVTVVVSEGPKAVPSVVGLTKDEARQRIRDAGFVPDFRTDTTSVEPKGTITDQINPSSEPTAPQGATIVLFVSAYVAPPPVPTPTPTPTDPTVPIPTDPVPTVPTTP